MKHEPVYSKVKVGERGQVTIPKRIRMEDNITSRDVMRLTHLPGGGILMQKIEKERPEDRIAAVIQESPRIDSEAAWKEVQSEREVER